jgi:hypothetical protein
VTTSEQYRAAVIRFTDSWFDEWGVPQDRETRDRLIRAAMAVAEEGRSDAGAFRRILKDQVDALKCDG